MEPETEKRDLAAFLVRAKRATYAGRGPEEATGSRLASHDFCYEEGAYRYLDSYVGGLEFSGTETVWRDGAPVWSMNYIGRTIDARFNGDFLKDALLLAREDAPFRGPTYHENGPDCYMNEWWGKLDWFHGKERVLHGGKMVYEMLYHGARIK